MRNLLPSIITKTISLTGVVASTTTLTVIGIIQIPGIDSTAQAQVFCLIGNTLSNCTPTLPGGIPAIPAIPTTPLPLPCYGTCPLPKLPPFNKPLIADATGPITITGNNKIVNNLSSGSDIDLYKLQLDFDANVTVESTGIFSLFLFNTTGGGLKTGSSKLIFSGVKNDIFYLGINGGIIPLNGSEESLLDPSKPGVIGSGILSGWQNLAGVSYLQAVFDYEISVTATPKSVPESNSPLNLLALGALGAASTLKRQLKPSKSSEKETTKVG